MERERGERERERGEREREIGLTIEKESVQGALNGVRENEKGGIERHHAENHLKKYRTLNCKPSFR